MNERVIVKEYKNEKEYAEDASKMLANGLKVINSTWVKPRPGVGRILAIGLFAIAFPPKPMLVVTYSGTPTEAFIANEELETALAKQSKRNSMIIYTVIAVGFLLVCLLIAATGA